jgi:small-conductance mechanosensitive channel
MPDLSETLDLSSVTVGSLVLAAVILIVAALVARWLRRRIRRQLGQQEGISEYLPDLLGRVAGWTVMIVGVVFALTAIGVDMSGVVLLVALLVVVVVLAGKGILENFAAGVLLQIRGPFRIGDRVGTEDYTGTVREINARAVVIETGDRRTVHVPNVDVLDGPIVNYTEIPDRRSEIGVGVAYDSDMRTARALMVDAAAGVDGVYDDPPPRAFVDEFGDSAVDLIVHFWHEDGERFDVRGRVAEAVKSALDGAGIDMPYPHAVVTIEGEGGAVDPR